MDNESSMTALIASFCRAYHNESEGIHVFSDDIAGQLMSDDEYRQIKEYMIGGINFFNPEKREELNNPEDILKWIVETQLAPTVLARARYCEDMLKNAIRTGTKQYVILGAGMDTFAYRNPELCSEIHLFEVDHPRTQKSKIIRIEQAGLAVPKNLHYVPVDFTDDNLAEKLQRSGFNTAKITFVSLLGVTYYLKRENMRNTIKAISCIVTEGSSLVFDYPDEGFLDSDVKRVQNQVAMAEAAGEPMKPGFSYKELEQLLEEYGFLIYEHLTPSDIDNRYFRNRTDLLHAFENINYVLAVKKG